MFGILLRKGALSTVTIVFGAWQTTPPDCESWSVLSEAEQALSGSASSHRGGDGGGETPPPDLPEQRESVSIAQGTGHGKGELERVAFDRSIC